MRIRYLQRPTHRHICYWLDLDNTLHDASQHILPAINRAMTQYVAQHLQLDPSAASQLRNQYWKQYGATLLGLIKHHNVNPFHFLEQTHQLPDLTTQVEKVRSVRHHLSRMKGTRILLTNAPRDYAERVLSLLGLKKQLHAVVSVEDMKIHGYWRPKPSNWLWMHLKAIHSSPRHALVEDTLGHLMGANRYGYKTAWIAPQGPYGKPLKHQAVQCRVRHFKHTAAWAHRISR